MIIEAPSPTYSTEVLMPNPDLGDSVSQSHEVNILRAMDGTLKTHTKTTDLRVFNYNFNRVSRQKCLEFIDLFFNHGGSKWRITDHNNEKIIGIILNNPLVFGQHIYDPYCVSNVLGSRESAALSFEFEGEIQ